MSISSAISSAQQKVANAYNAVSLKGGTLPLTQDLANLPTAINSIHTGGTISSLSITPSTSSQTITASGGIDGYSPITVSAVDSNIDPNILSNNIKNGVTILGITGSLVELKGASLSASPQTTERTYSPPPPFNGFTSVVISAVTSSIDSNIQAGNIKDGVTILGVTGTYTPQTISEPYIEYEVVNNMLYGSRTTSHVIDLTGVTHIYAGLGYAYYNNTVITTAPDFSSVTSIFSASCFNMFYGASNLTGNINLGSLNYADRYGCLGMFYGTKITGLTLGISGQSNYFEKSFYNMCRNCKSLTTVSAPNLTKIRGTEACADMFSGCSLLTTTILGNVTEINGGNSTLGPCMSMYADCTSLTDINMNNLQKITGSGELGCALMFSGCTSLTTATLPALEEIQSKGCQRMFQNSGLTTLSFPALKSTSFGNSTDQFHYMLLGVTGCTVHFPSNLQAIIGSWTDVVAGFGGTNTTVLFDLPATT